jgi:cysteinyl-tRNA synthetase
VRIYTCGPTVHDYAHIGNFRTFVFGDIMRRYLIYKGYRVTQVMNRLTSMIRRFTGAPGEYLLSEYVSFTPRLFRDLQTLNIERAEHYPAATEHIPDMVALIQRLLERGYAYQAGGSVYFKVDAFLAMANFPIYRNANCRLAPAGAWIPTSTRKKTYAISPCGRVGPG